MRSVVAVGACLVLRAAVPEPVSASSAVPAFPSVPSFPSAVRGAAASASPFLQEPDSTDLLDRARDAQSRFESERWRRLPRALSGGGGDCDDVVGRMCWRHGPDSWWVPEPEPTDVQVARRELLDTLAALARRLPGDDWIVGQRVWYLGEAGLPGEALEVARSCRGTPWWCRALEGLSLHLLGRYSDAMAAYGAALAGMSDERAARWRDVDPLLDPDARGALDRARRSGTGAAFLERFWTLADPLFLVEGNDRRTEHLARRTVARIRERARNPHRISWGWDLEELLIRYGWAVGWERTTGMTLEARGAIGHEHPESRTFVPPGSVLAGEGGERIEAGDAAWSPDGRYAPSAYAPRYAPLFLPAPGQVGVTRRGDTAVVVAAVSLPRDTTARTRRGRTLPVDTPPSLVDRGPETGLALVTPDGRTTGLSRSAGGAGTHVARGAGDLLASAEAWEPGRAGRIRFRLPSGRTLPDVLSLSDILVLVGDDEPGSWEEAAASLAPELRAVAGGAVRLGWEVGGLGFRDEVLEYRLAFVSTERGFFERIGGWLGLGGDDEPRLLSWEEPGPDRPGPVFRTVGVTLPIVEPGRYVLRLEVRSGGRSPVVAERGIEVVDSAVYGEASGGTGVDGLPLHF